MEADVLTCRREGTQVTNRLVGQCQREPNGWERRTVAVPLVRVITGTGVPMSVKGEGLAGTGCGGRCTVRTEGF